MTRHLTFLALLIGLSLSAFAQAQQSKLPPCPKVDYSKKTDAGKTTKWNKCFGKIVIEFDEYSKGDVYEGEYNNRKLNGLGTHKYVSGNIYTGMFKDGNYHGQGTLISADGIKFTGNFKDGRRNGYGIEKYVDDGSIKREGIWDSFELVESKNKKILSKEKKNDNKNLDFFVIPPKFETVGVFNEELAPVRIFSKKYGFIDKKGEFVIKPQFDEAHSFSEGLAAVRIGDIRTGKWGFIDKQGKFVVNPQFDFILSFKEGLAAFQIGDYLNGKWGFIDKQGKVIIKPEFNQTSGFNEGLAAVRIGDIENGKWGFIDKQGKFVINPQFKFASNFFEGLASIEISSQDSIKSGFIDKQGNFVIAPVFDYTSVFSEGLAAVRISDNKTGKYGYIDKQGNFIINPQFDGASLFKEGLAQVRIGVDKTGKYGYIDKKGKFVINPQFDDSNSFSDGLASVRVGDDKTGKWGYIDTQGNFVISPQFYNSWDYATSFYLYDSFHNGYAASCIEISLTKQCGFISKESVQSSKLASVSPEQKNQNDKKQKSSKLSLQASTTTPDANGAVIITVRTNADTSSLKVNGEEQGGRPDGNYVIKKVARVGQDTNYVITAVDTNGNTDSTTITVARQAVSSSSNQSASLKPESIKRAASRDAVAIIIGIQNYKRVPKAEFANNDAKEFYEYAIRGLGIKPENIKLLVDEEADEVNIVKAFENWLPLQVNKNKTDVYVFYSGHGLPSSDGKSLYFLPHGVDKELLSRTAVGQAEVVSALVASKPKSVTMFIDACYSGQTRGGETLLASAKPISLKTDTNLFPSNFTVITASANDQISSSSPELKHGIFSFYLMKGFEGDADGNKDGKITAGEMQEYLQDKVSRQAMSMSRKQDTQLVGDANKVLMGR